MAKSIRIMCLHGLGDHRTANWQSEWKSAIERAIGPGAGVTPEFLFSTYDPIFERTKLSFGETMKALWQLSRSGISNFGRTQRGIVSDISDRIRWTAGYVVAWVGDEEFQKETRTFVLDEIRSFQPDVILAHSLGSLISYNALSHEDAEEPQLAAILKKAHYVTFGSQIANPFVIGNLTHGRVRTLSVRHWHHLYNENDDVFTAPINLRDVPNFNQLLTPFDLAGIGDHAAGGYLGHQVTSASLWMPLVAERLDSRSFGVKNPWARDVPARPREAQRKALLVGINDYPREDQRLSGCVNDVFTMSAVLQECGFAPEEIRTCLDDRATAAGILERLEWLVDGVKSGDRLVFYYSGHGARIPEYGDYQEPDRLTETLVPYDFDFSPETCISDEQIFALYSQLPYDLDLMLFFDCCHSGGIHRQGSARARGITPPDDIRHRQLKWDAETEMWVERDFERINDRFSRAKGVKTDYFGANGTTVRLGRSSMLRRDGYGSYEAAAKKSKGPIGPYLPLIIEACREDEFSYEYRHGATSYGAFTYCLASILREEKNISFEDIVKMTTDRLAELGYDQVPQILGPSIKTGAKVPFRTGAAARNRPPTGLPGSSTARASG